MKALRLMHCIGDVDDELILEADTARFHGRRWVQWAALAACAALVLAIPFQLNRYKSAAGESGRPQTVNSLKEDPGEDAGQTEAATEPANGEAAQEDDLALEPTYNTDPIVTAESIAGLKLGMEAQKVVDVLGQPESAVLMDDYGGQLERWTYNGGLNLVLGDLGGGWFLNEIYLTERGYTLSSGIGVGSTAKEVEAAYPGILGMEDLIWDFVYATNEDLNGLYLTIIDGAVSYVALGPWVLDFTVGNTEPSLLDRLTSNEITIYTWNTTAQSWDAVTAINRAAKGISTVLTISEPEPTEPPEGAPVLWLDFGNGTAATLWGDDTATIYTYEGTFDIQNPNPKALTHYLTGRFPGLDDYVQRAWDNPTLTWETEEKAP